MRSLLALLLFTSTAFADLKVGLASRDITPTDSIWMAGYGGRKEPAKGTMHPLWVKVMVLEDENKNRLVLLTSDLCGIPRSLSQPVCERVMKETGLKREQIMLTSSHTHSGPVVKENLFDMYDMPEVQKTKVREYGKLLEEMMVETIMKAVKDVQPAKVTFGVSKADFAINRREAREKGVVIGLNPKGPVDHSVPVMLIHSPKGDLRSVVFGYACHNTTLDGLLWSGDYAGFAQIELEKAHPGALAMFWIGCGADANPNPRRTVELAEKHGKTLAESVEKVIADKKLNEIYGPLSAKYREITLDLDKVPTREQLLEDSKSKTFAVATRANRFLKTIAEGGQVPTTYSHYPIQVWKLGKSVEWVALGGEVVVDYILRLKKDHKGPLWITGYANDVMAYIPSERVLKEGGYEADSSMIYYGMPSRWKAGLEDKIIGAVKEMLKETP